MKRKRRTEITIETREILHVRGGTQAVSPPCPVCGRGAQLVPAEEAARRSQLGLRQLFRLVETGHVHFVKTSEGQLLICLDSLREV